MLQHKLNPAQLTTNRDAHTNQVKKKYVVVLYINNLTHQISKVFPNKSEISLGFRGINKLNKFIKVLKDPLHNDDNKNVIYKIECSNCDAVYVGKTKRKLQTRINEHKNRINKNNW